jgi:hypothetical protein
MNRVIWILPAVAMLIGGGQAKAANVLISGTEMNATIVSDLAARGLTATIVNPANLATTSFAGYSAIWLGWNTTYSFDGTTLGKFQAFINGGGNVFAETPYTNVLSFLPGVAGVTTTNFDGQNVHITATADPVMAGLTDAGLSGWGNSYHNYYNTLGTFGGLAQSLDVGGNPSMIIGQREGLGYLTLSGQDASFHAQYGAGDTSPTSPKMNLVIDTLNLPNASSPVPEPASMSLLGLGALGLFGYGVRRKAKATA